MPKQLLHFNQTVDKSMVTRKIVDGAESIVIRSATLPDNIVMNGGLYPAEEIANSFASLERVLAPIGHPQKNGKFISASDPFAVNNFHVGAYVANVERRDGKVYHDTIINIKVAQQSAKGRELLEAIANMEATGEPIHTSTGVLLEREPLDAPQVNAAGTEYSWIARNMMFDHNAILLNQPGAATPEQGVGMMVNQDMVDMDSFATEEVSLIERVDTLKDALKDHVAMREEDADWIWIADIYPESSEFIYEIQFENGADEYRKRSYSIADDGEVMIGENYTKVKKKWKWVANRKLETFISNMKFAPSIDAVYNEIANNQNSHEDLEMTKEELQAMLAPMQESIEKLQANQDQLATLTGDIKAKLEVNENAEREALEVEAKALGYGDDVVEGMTTNALKAVLAKQTGKPSATKTAGGMETNSQESHWDSYDLNAEG